MVGSPALCIIRTSTTVKWSWDIQKFTKRSQKKKITREGTTDAGPAPARIATLALGQLSTSSYPPMDEPNDWLFKFCVQLSDF